MGLAEYKKKRTFSKTPEPKGEQAEKGLFRYVVQRHDASRLHYDLRLEMDGVLKSWAVPKGPSLNPKDKRLAVETEDHPVEYLHFQGDIPKGNYGAGRMDIWDEGSYGVLSAKTEAGVVKAWKKGELKIEFHGKKLQGKFTLVRMELEDEKKQWFLIKKKDEFSTDQDYDAEEFTDVDAEPAPVTELNPNRAIQPMLASLAEEIFDRDEWIFERKWDGYRILAHVNDGQVDLYSRNGLNYNRKYPSIVESLSKIPHAAVLDGEMVVVDRNGVPDFQRLQHMEDDGGDLRYYVFDLLFLNGHATLELPLIERKGLIEDVIESAPFVEYSDHVIGKGKAFFKKVVNQGFEGVMAKKADSRYLPGQRSKNWLKIKATGGQEAIICGYTESRKASRPFESLILGVWDDEALTYIGNCGSGFGQADQKELLEILESLETNDSPFSAKIDLKGRKPHWVQPQLVCEVKFSEWTKDGRLRHPVFKGLREDKTAGEVRRELPNSKSSQKTPPKYSSPKQTSRKVAAKGSDKDETLNIDGINVPVTNLDKLYWPDEGLKKYDLIDYYIQMSDTIMSYLKGRPQNMHRHPDGASRPGFYQKDTEGNLPDWAESVTVHSESANKDIEYLVCNNAATLIYMANLGCIEINPWHSKVGSLDQPEYGIIDLDPSPKNTFEEVIEVAQAVKSVMDQFAIEGCCKTSGSRGIHVYLPMGGKYTYDEVRDFMKLLCHYVMDMVPKLSTMERPLKARKGRIYLDYLQNKSAQTMAVAYSARPKKGATVSAPIEWKELKKGLQLSDFHIGNMSKRVKEKGDLFKTVLGKGVNLEKVLEKMGE